MRFRLRYSRKNVSYRAHLLKRCDPAHRRSVEDPELVVGNHRVERQDWLGTQILGTSLPVTFPASSATSGNNEYSTGTVGTVIRAFRGLI